MSYVRGEGNFSSASWRPLPQAGLRAAYSPVPVAPPHNSDIETVHTTKPLRAYKGFNIAVDAAGTPVLQALIQQHYLFDGPVARTEPPRCQARYDAIMADPLAALERLGERELLRRLMQREVHGFYAYKQAGCVLAPNESPAFALLVAHIEAAVDLFGTVVEHELGYRAEALRINYTRLLVPVNKDVHQALERRYQCEVLPCRSEERSESTRYSLMTLTGLQNTSLSSLSSQQSKQSLWERLRQRISLLLWLS